MIRQYDLMYLDETAWRYGKITMEPKTGGDWVKFEDHQKVVAELKARIAELEEEVTIAKDDQCGFEGNARWGW